MDPDATLKKLRTLAARYDSDPDGMPTSQFEAMVELFAALDGWITRGGYLPDAWYTNTANYNRKDV